MKKTLFRLLGFCGIIGGMISLNSCKKEVVNPVTKDTSTTHVTTMMNTSVNEVTDISLQMLTMMLSIKSDNMTGKMEDAQSIATCATRTIDSSSNPRTLTYDWGTGCTNGDGELRKGKVVISYNFDQLSKDQLLNPGTHVDINFVSFTMDTTTYSGTLTFDNNGYNGSGNMEFRIITNLNIHREVSNTDMTANSSFTIEWTAGEGTETKDDDQYTVTIGSIAGTYFDGSPFNITVAQPLLLTNDACSEYPVSGKLTGTLPNGDSVEVNYGDGTCDNLAEVTRNGVTQTVDLSEN